MLTVKVVVSYKIRYDLVFGNSHEKSRLRDPEYPDLSWEDYEKLLAANPDRPFYVPGKTFIEQFYKAQERCDKYERRAQHHSDCTLGIYWTCEEDKTDE